MNKIKTISLAVTPPPQFILKAKSFIGGNLEEIKLNNKYSLIVDAEGKLKKLPKNNKATRLYNYCYKTNDYLCGNVLLIKYKKKFD
jgi:hypothetical protein